MQGRKFFRRMQERYQGQNQRGGVAVENEPSIPPKSIPGIQVVQENDDDQRGTSEVVYEDFRSKS